MGCVCARHARIKNFQKNQKTNKMGNNGKTIEAEVMDHQFAHEGNAPDLGWAAHDHNKGRPDKVIMEEEDRVRELDRAEVDRVRSETMMKLFDTVLIDWGRKPNPADVGKKVLAMAKFCGHRAVDGWSLGEIAEASGETKAALSARIRRTCNKPIEAAGGTAQARFQQGPDQRAVSANAQKGNSNRAGK